MKELHSSPWATWKFGLFTCLFYYLFLSHINLFYHLLFHSVFSIWTNTEGKGERGGMVQGASSRLVGMGNGSEACQVIAGELELSMEAIDTG